ncbi:plasmid mobilization protein [Kitasatospora griseola]|uniref:plasmid mobilization protein n=1 Tax=Kitasatospora griseola TaxID=2064 RepID=UPI003855D283
MIQTRPRPVPPTVPTHPQESPLTIHQPDAGHTDSPDGDLEALLNSPVHKGDPQPAPELTAPGAASYRVGPPQRRPHAGPSPVGEGQPAASRAGALDPSPAARHQGVPSEVGEESDRLENIAPSQATRQPRRRHRDPQQRPHRVTVRYNAAEFEEIRRAAAARSQTVARFCATSTLNDARGLSAGDPQDCLDRAVDELAASRAQLARVGNNLNQVAFALNANGFLRPAELAAALDLVRHAVARVDATAAALVGG